MTLAYLYAEYLRNIQQVTVVASLPTVANPETAVHISPNGRLLRLIHGGKISTIDLPAAVQDNACSRNLTIGTKDLSFRFEVTSDSQSQAVTGADTFQWSASRFTEKTEVACVKCKYVLVDSISQWKDLPSGGWAEMMDFWHCHKPSVQNGTSASTRLTKGYEASNTIGPVTGIGLIDISYFWFQPSDCIGVKVSSLTRFR